MATQEQPQVIPINRRDLERLCRQLEAEQARLHSDRLGRAANRLRRLLKTEQPA